MRYLFLIAGILVAYTFFYAGLSKINSDLTVFYKGSSG